MQTPTIIVRLIGIYMLTASIMALVQIGRFTTAMPVMPGVNVQQNQMIGDFQIYAWIGIVIGLAATAFAGILARLLTFDAGPRRGHDDLSDRFFGR
jgi:hypothetical protein